ncbi:MAG: GNAT family N-acetyltransferase [Betaproteobacteria bacterium]|nr:GNAT family N-acetyltransferase [Betaproteobacteria bacterium]
MAAPATLHGARVVLRPWRDDDRAPLRAMNADARVMRYFPATLSDAQSDALYERARTHVATHGWGIWALEVDGKFAGFTGLARPRFTAHFTPCVEVGWRLAAAYWGHGYATEAARLALAHAFGALQLDEVVSFTSRSNTPSIAVMQRLGMHSNSADDFLHPALAPTHPLAPHVLYRLSRCEWQATPAADAA